MKSKSVVDPVIDFTAGDLEYFRNSSSNEVDVLVPKPIGLLNLYESSLKSKALKEFDTDPFLAGELFIFRNILR